MNKIAGVFGTVNPPPGLATGIGTTEAGAQVLVQIVLRTMIIGAGVYAIFNLILAGYAYISAGGDSKAIAAATGKITQTVIGLTVAAGAFVIAGVISQIIYGSPTTLLQLQIF